ncbi:hypothetical protein DBR40_06685 [Pedobacter sp. KBW01]|nr:hypothetical protein DBR40_06685 [Pedobacter sp. KBW01]
MHHLNLIVTDMSATSKVESMGAFADNKTKPAFQKRIIISKISLNKNGQNKILTIMHLINYC